MKIKKSIFLLALLPMFVFMGCKKDRNTPHIFFSNPLNNSIEVPRDSKITFGFDMEMDETTINNSTVTLTQAGTLVDGTVEYADKLVTFSPAAELMASKVYVAQVTTGALGSKKGEPLERDFSITFTTSATSGSVDVIAPIINSTSPSDNSIGVPRNKNISVVFNEPMDPLSITTTSFTLKNGTSNVEGLVFYSNNTATFISTNNLAANTKYTVTISTGAKDLAGNALASNNEWVFTTSNTSATLSMVNLGNSANYLILAKTAINNSSTSSLVGDLALSPAATSYITGLALVNATGYAISSQVTGKVYAADMAAPTPSLLTTAVNDMITAYNDAAGRPTPDFLELNTGNIGGKTLSPGLYKWTSTVTIPTDMTISGGANDVWIFQMSGDLNQSSAVKITLEGGAQAKNIFWQVAGEATIGANAHFEGNILSMTGITFLTGASMNGRALAQTAVILDSNNLTKVQ